MSDVYEKAADMMAQSLCAGAVPRHVVLRKLRETFPNPADLQVWLDKAVRIAAELDAAGLTIAYDPQDLERVRELQRKLT